MQGGLTHNKSNCTRMYAKGSVAGVVEWFQAEVINTRSKFPPTQLKCISTLDGNTNSLVLPQSLTVYIVREGGG